MDALSITGCWEGALLSAQGGIALPFTLQQPPGALSLTSGPQVRIGSNDAAPTRLLDCAARAFVALVDEARDPVSGRLAQLLVDARVRGDRLVGEWFRRDDEGHILASGLVEAKRVGST
jgi:hypothetical protein